jgi:hypothetical protein
MAGQEMAFSIETLKSDNGRASRRKAATDIRNRKQCPLNTDISVGSG